ncbi:hypothetical protein MMC30_007800 [Trapelia coarctata]|nr:hypothetical protein [Trapelia coarctata]
MGYWGFKIFQSDHAYDLIEEINADPGLKLYFFDDEAAEVAAKDALNNGLLGRLVAKYEFDLEKSCSGRDHKIVLLTALAMETGAILSDNLRAKVKSMNQKLGVPDVAREQMRVAIEEYVSGQPYNSDSPGLHEQMVLNTG